MKSAKLKQTSKWYTDYYRKMGDYRNDLYANSEVLFQTLAYDRSIISALAKTKVSPLSARVIDVGCGGGYGLINFIRLGFQPQNIVGIDMLEDRITLAQKLFPNINFSHGDASHIEFPDNEFDIVTESKMLFQIIDEGMAQSIANEMIRVTNPKGYILLIDWRYSNPWDKTCRGLNLERIKKLFDIGVQTQVFTIIPGALVPPVGRFFSKFAPSFYFTTGLFMPFLIGQIAVVLRKIKPEID